MLGSRVWVVESGEMQTLGGVHEEQQERARRPFRVDALELSSLDSAPNNGRQHSPGPEHHLVKVELG